MNATGPIVSLIAANSTANAIFAGRVYPEQVKQSAGYPAAAVSIIAGSGNHTKSGVSDTDSLLVQVDVYDTTYSGAAAGAEAIRGAIDYYSGNVTLPAGGGTVNVDSISFSGAQDGFSGKPELFRTINEYRVRIKR